MMLPSLKKKKILKLNSKLRSISLKFSVYFFNTLFSIYLAHYYYLQGIYNFV